MLKSARVSKASLWLGGALAVGLVCAAAAPVCAQTVVDEVTVIGRYGVGPEVQSLSAPVGYADLDLTTEAGRAILADRVRASAHDLCRRLGESGMGSTGAAPSCEQAAIDNARGQERTAYLMARPPAYALIAPPPPVDEPYVAPAGVNPMDEAPAASAYGSQASATVTTETVTNGTVPDTPQNRARYGQPMSNGGRQTAPVGN